MAAKKKKKRLFLTLSLSIQRGPRRPKGGIETINVRTQDIVLQYLHSILPVTVGKCNWTGLGIGMLL